MKPFKLFVPFTPGFEKISLKEITQLDIKIDTYDSTGCLITGHWKHIFRLNEYAKTINRVYIRFAEFKALSFPELFNKLQGLDFTDFLTQSNICIRVNSFKSKLYHENAIKELFIKYLKSLNADYQFNILGSPDHEDTQMFLLNFSHDILTISVDTTGIPLYKRAYLKYRSEAPLRENIVAAMYQCLKAEQYSTIIDPFCGSGTIALEFLMNERNSVNSLYRSFSFMHWKNFDENYYKQIPKLLNEDTITNYISYDIDADCVEISRKNYSLIKQKEAMIIEEKDFFTLIPDTFNNNSAIVCNPPWGKRLKNEPISEILQRLSEISEMLPVYCLIPAENLHYLSEYELLFSTNSGAIKVVFIKIKKRIDF